MIRLLFRSLGLLALAAAFCALLYDGTRTIADSELRMTPLREIWIAIDPKQPATAKARIEESSYAWIWNWIAAIIGTPAVLIFAILGVALSLLGRKKPEPLPFET